MKKVLIIDDDELVRFTVRQILEDEGYAVVEARNGMEGLEKYRTESPDIVITDMLMPEKEGLETIMDLKRIEPRVKIIAVSGGGRINNSEFLDVAKTLGADAVLQKPFANRTLVGLIRAQLG